MLAEVAVDVFVRVTEVSVDVEVPSPGLAGVVVEEAAIDDDAVTVSEVVLVMM